MFSLLMCTFTIWTYVLCINGRMYVCCSECYVVSNECDEHTPWIVRYICEHVGKVMYIGGFCLRGAWVWFSELWW